MGDDNVGREEELPSLLRNTYAPGSERNLQPEPKQEPGGV